jgi:hypothetical protein
MWAPELTASCAPVKWTCHAHPSFSYHHQCFVLLPLFTWKSTLFSWTCHTRLKPLAFHSPIVCWGTLLYTHRHWALCQRCWHFNTCILQFCSFYKNLPGMICQVWVNRDESGLGLPHVQHTPISLSILLKALWRGYAFLSRVLSMWVQNTYKLERLTHSWIVTLIVKAAKFHFLKSYQLKSIICNRGWVTPWHLMSNPTLWHLKLVKANGYTKL